MFPIAILAGGLATRLGPLTQRVPKSLVDVAGRPFVDWQLEWLAIQGIRRVVFCVGHLGAQMEEYLGTGARYGLDISFSYDGPQLLGTGGALRKALPLLGNDFFVLYGDSYLPVDYRRAQTAYLDGGRPALMTIYANCSRWDKSNVVFVNGEIERYDKKNLSPEMSYIDAGLSIVSSGTFAALPAGEASDFGDFLRDLVVDRLVTPLEVAERFYEIGSVSGLEEFDAFVRSSPNLSTP